MLLAVLIALLIFILFPVVKEKYQNIVLDTPNRDAKNKPIRTGGPFNTCSPENIDECPKMEMPHLSRY